MQKRIEEIGREIIAKENWRDRKINDLERLRELKRNDWEKLWERKRIEQIERDRKRNERERD